MASRALPNWVRFVALSILCGCQRERAPVATPSEPVSASVAPAVSEARKRPPERFRLLDHLRSCELRDESIVFDLGGDAEIWRRGYGLPPLSEVDTVERAGAEFLRLKGPISVDFWLTEPQTNLALQARVHPGSARQLTAAIGRQRLGVRRLPPEVTSVASFSIAGTLAPGRHSLTLSFGGIDRRRTEPPGEVDWLRLHAKEQASASYVPTRRDVVTNVVLSDQPRLSLGLKRGVRVRCPVRLSTGAVFSTSLGFWGKGHGRAEVRFLQDGQPPRLLAEKRITGGEGAQWSELEVKLDEFASVPGLLELYAAEVEGPGRVAFGDPRLELDGEAPVAQGRLAVVVILSALSEAHLVGPRARGKPLERFLSEAVSFSGYQVPATAPAGVLASLLTGLSPSVHGLENVGQALHPRLGTLPRALKAEGGRAAFFTSVPSTFPEFGFGPDFQELQAFSPVLDVSSTEGLARAGAFIEQGLAKHRERPQLLIVHARGAHPPWDLSKLEVQRLPPEEYSGAIDPRRAAIVIGEVRRRGRRLKDEDWLRLLALEDLALERQALAVKKLLGVLEKHGLYRDALVVLMGDVGTPPPPALPYHPEGPLEASRLSSPLAIKFPGALQAGLKAQAPVTTVDLAWTLTQYLGLPMSKPAGAVDLLAASRGATTPLERTLLSTRGSEYLARAGDWQLKGRVGRVPVLCNLAADPECQVDQFGAAANTARVLWVDTFERLLSDRAERVRLLGGTEAPAAELDPATRAALTVWGDQAE